MHQPRAREVFLIRRIFRGRENDLRSLHREPELRAEATDDLLHFLIHGFFGGFSLARVAQDLRFVSLSKALAIKATHMQTVDRDLIGLLALQAETDPLAVGYSVQELPRRRLWP